MNKMLVLNPQVLAAVTMFTVSEVLPHLPCEANSVLQLAIKSLNQANIIPDATYRDFQTSSHSTERSTGKNIGITIDSDANVDVEVKIKIRSK